MKPGGIGRRALEVLGLAMIGEGVVGTIQPRRYPLFWKRGPQWLRDTAEFFADRPDMTRLVCMAEAAAGPPPFRILTPLVSVELQPAPDSIAATITAHLE